MFNFDLGSKGAAVTSSNPDAMSNIAGSGTMRDVLKGYEAIKFSNWRASKSTEGRKICYFEGKNKSGQYIPMSIMSSAKDETAVVGQRPNLDTPVIQNAKTGAFFTAPNGAGNENVFEG